MLAGASSALASLKRLPVSSALRRGVPAHLPRPTQTTVCRWSASRRMPPLNSCTMYSAHGDGQRGLSPPLWKPARRTWRLQPSTGTGPSRRRDAASCFLCPVPKPFYRPRRSVKPAWARPRPKASGLDGPAFGRSENGCSGRRNVLIASGGIEQRNELGDPPINNAVVASAIFPYFLAEQSRAESYAERYYDHP